MKTWAKHLFFRQNSQGRKGNLGKTLLDQRFKKVGFLHSKSKIFQKPYLYNIFNKKNYYNLNFSKKVRSKNSHTYSKVSDFKKFGLIYKNVNFSSFSYDINYNVPILSKSQLLNDKGEFFSIKENQPRHNIFRNSKSLFTVSCAAQQAFRSFQKTSKYRRLKPCFAVGGKDSTDGTSKGPEGNALYGPINSAVGPGVQGSEDPGSFLATSLNFPFNTFGSRLCTKGARATTKGLAGKLQGYLQNNNLVKYLSNKTLQQVKVNTKWLYVFIIKILRRYKLQKQSIKYQLAIRNTCKLILIYVFGSFCWLYLACYSTTKEKFNNRKIGFLFQETVSKNLPLFQKNPSFYTKETVENTVFLSTNFVGPYWNSYSKPIVEESSIQLINQISNSSISGPLVKIKLSSFFRDFSTQNYLGLFKEKAKHKYLGDTTSKKISVFSNQQNFFFARKPLLITQEKIGGVNFEKQKLSHREQYFFSGTSMVMGPEIDFLPRQLKTTRKTLATKIKRANTSKISSIGSFINFSPQLAITEQLKWCNILNPKFLFLGEQSPKKLEEIRQGLSQRGLMDRTVQSHRRKVQGGFGPIGPEPGALHKVHKVQEDALGALQEGASKCWTESPPISKKNEEPVDFLFRSLAIKTVASSRTSGSIDIVIEPRMQSGFNFPDAPIIKKDPENWKNGIAISLKKDLVSNEINYVIPSFAQSSISVFSNPSKDLNNIFRHCENKIGLQNEQIKIFSKTPFLELLYRERPLHNSYNQIFTSTHYSNTSFKNHFSTEDSLNVGALEPLGSLSYGPGARSKAFGASARSKAGGFGPIGPEPGALHKVHKAQEGALHKVHNLLQDPWSKSTANKRFKELWGEVKTFINIIENKDPLLKLISEKKIKSSSVNFVILDKNADIKTFNCLLGGRLVKQELVKYEAEGHSSVSEARMKAFYKKNIVPLCNILPLTYLMPSNLAKLETLLKTSESTNIFEKNLKLLEQKNLNSLVFSPESFFGTPYLQLGERFTIEKIKNKNQIGVLYNVHNGDINAPINSNYPFANMGTSLKTVFGKKWLKQQSSIKAAKTQRVTNARLVSKWEVAHLDNIKNNFDNFSINSLLEKNLGKAQTTFNQNQHSPSSVQGLLYLKRISGKANGHLINPFKYYNPGTKRERNIEDTMLTFEGYKKSRLFSKTHTYYQGINTGSLAFKLGFYDYLRDSDIDVQSILGGMRQSTESQRRAENITGAPNVNLEEFQKNKNITTFEIVPQKDTSTSTVKKKKKYPFTNCYPFPTLLVNSSQKPFPKNLKPIDKAEYNFSSFSIEQKPINTYNTTVLKGLGQTKGFYFEKIFINKKLGFTLDHASAALNGLCSFRALPKVQFPLPSVLLPGEYNSVHHKVQVPGKKYNLFDKKPKIILNPYFVPVARSYDPCSSGAPPKGFFNGNFLDFSEIIQLQIWGSLTKILFFIAVWSSYRILAIPLSQSTPFLPAAFTEAIGLNSFQQKYRIITREKIRHFKNVAGNEKTLSELQNLIWLFPLVDTRKNSDFLRSFPYVGSQAGNQRISLRFKERNRFLLYGPPGTGKTLLVRALASEANVPIIVQPVSQLKMIAGVENPVSALFHVARQIKPCIIFLDELDTLGTNLENSTAYITPEQKLGIRLARKYTYTLLLELDGLTSSTDNLLVIGATNRPETLNPALMRPGRFETIINCSLPDEKQRLAVLSLYLFYYKQKVSTITTFQPIKPFALKQKARKSKFQSQLTRFNTPIKGVKRKLLINTDNKTPWDILSENWLLKRKKQPQFFNDQNNKLFYVNYIAQKCFGLSQASIETIVNESALELIHKGVGSLIQHHHTLKSLERAIESVRILTSQETNNSVFSLFKQNKEAVTSVSSTANSSEKTKNKAPLHQGGATMLQNQKSYTQGYWTGPQGNVPIEPNYGPTGPKLTALDLDKVHNKVHKVQVVHSRVQVQPQEVRKFWYKIVDSVDSALLEALSKAIRVTNGKKNKFIKAQTIKPQLKQFWVNSAYKITGSFIFSQKINYTPSRRTQDLHINEISQQTTKQGLQFLLQKQYAGHASLSLYTTTRPQIIKLSETFGLYKNPANYGTNVLMLQNLIGLDFAPFCTSGLDRQVHAPLGARPTAQGHYRLALAPKVSDQQSYTQGFTSSETLGSKKSYFVPETEFLKLNKTNLLFGSFSPQTKKNLHNNNVDFSFQHQISCQIKLNNWLTTGWFRAYLSRPIFRYDNKEYIENKEYYPQNNYTLVSRRPKSINVSTLAHQSKELNFLKSKKALGSITEVQEGKIVQHKTFIIEKKKQIFSENVSDTQSLYLAIVASAFHQGLLVIQKNRELIDYCVYNILRYGVLYEFSISQICKKF